MISVQLLRILIAPAMVFIAVVAVSSADRAVGQQQADMIIGLDMQPATNAASELGRLQPCTEAAVGTTFNADVFIANVSGLAAWELRLEYDPSVLQIEQADFNQMLVSTQPSGLVFPSLFEAETPSRHFMAAVEINGTPDSGSGVLAHVSMRAIKQGESKLTISDSPTRYGPRIVGDSGSPIGDDTGDGIWDHAITDGTVVVGSECPSTATPIPTPITGPSQSPGGGAGSGSGSSSSSGSASGGAGVAVVDSDPPGDGEDGAGGDSDAFTDDTDDGSDGAGGEGEGDTVDDGQGEASPDDAEVPNAAGSGNDDGGASLPIVIGAIALGAVAIGAGTLFVFRRRDTW